MQFTPLFDQYLPSTSGPVFQRVKAKDENPGFNYEFIDFTCSNINGLAVHREGWTILTPIYRTTLYCDVCELPVQETKIYGKTREVHVNCFVDFATDEKAKLEFERGDQATFNDLKKFVNLIATYKRQCSRCGRWIAKGNKHVECNDETYGICKYCANTMRKIIR